MLHLAMAQVMNDQSGDGFKNFMIDISVLKVMIQDGLVQLLIATVSKVLLSQIYNKPKRNRGNKQGL